MTARRAPTKREAAAIAALLLVGRKSSAAMVAALTLSTRALLARHAHPLQIAHGIQTSQATLIQQARQSARGRSMDRWSDDTGIRTESQPVALDAMRAWSAAAAIAHAWTTKRGALEAIGEATGTKASRLATESIIPNVQRTAVTETASAWNAEVVRLNDRAFAVGYEVTETWSALIDACHKCWALDGTTVTRPDRFPGDPPLHPQCACIISTDVRAIQFEAA